MQGPVFYFTRTLPAYRIPILERLDSVLGNRLVVLYGDPPSGSSLRALEAAAGGSLRSLKLKSIWVGGERLHYQAFGSAFKRFGRPAAILAEESPRSVSLPLLLLRARASHIPVVLWGHFSSNYRPASEVSFSDRYRFFLARRANACVCYTDEIADLLRPYIRSERIFVARNTLDMDQLFQLADTLSSRGKAEVRQEVGLEPELPCLVFLGRLVPEKGMDMLLDVMVEMRQRRPLQWLIIGDGPARPLLEAGVGSRSVPNVHFVGAKPSFDESAPLLYASSMMVNPGNIGLAVNHAFAFGLPVVTQQSPGPMRYHGPEGAFLEHGVNAMLTRHGSVSAMADAVEHVLENLESFSRSASKYAHRELTVDRMVGGLEEAIRYSEKGLGP